MTRTLVEQKFAAAASGYATSEVHARGESLARLVGLVAPQTRWRALDIATGAGHVAMALAPCVAHVVAADLTEEMLGQARALAAERGILNVEAIRARAEALPFPDASFDLVTCRIAAHHFDDVTQFVCEVARVLRPGGTFGLVDNVGPDADLVPDASEDEIAAADAAYTGFEKLRDPSHVRALTLAEWQRLIESAGLAITHVERLSKVIDLASWARRMLADEAAVAALSRCLDGASPALASFLRPLRAVSGPTFTLHEGLIVARKRT